MTIQNTQSYFPGVPPRALLAATRELEQPLTAEEKKVCRLLGLSEEQYLAERNTKIVAKLGSLESPTAGLDAAELEVCRLLNITPGEFSASKALETR